MVAQNQYCSCQINTYLCDSRLCEMGHHAFACAKRARYVKHHVVRDLLYDNSRKTGAIAEVEQIVSGFSTATGRNTFDKVLVADIRIQENIGHTPKWVDVVNVHNYGWSSTKQKYLPTTAGMAVKTKEHSKNAKCDQRMASVYPFAIDTCGRIGREGHQLSQLFATSLKAKKLGSVSVFRKSFYEDIACAICKGNTATWLHFLRRPDSHDPAHFPHWDLAAEGWSDGGEWSDFDGHEEI